MNAHSPYKRYKKKRGKLKNENATTITKQVRGIKRI